MEVKLVNFSVCLDEFLQVLQVSFLCSNVRCSVSVVVLSVKVVAGLDEHLEYVVPILEPGGQVQRIVALLVRVINVDALLSEDAHDVAVAAPGRNPEGIEAVLVLLVNVNHLVFEHESHERLAEPTNSTLKLPCNLKASEQLTFLSSPRFSAGSPAGPRN